MFPFGDTIPTKRWAIVTYFLVAINALSFLWFQSLPEREQMKVTAQWGFVPARVEQLANPQKVVEVQIGQRQRVFLGVPVGVQPIVARPQPIPSQILASAITCMFLHGSWWHLIGNMWFLLIFGDNIEDRLGHGLFAVFYLLGGLAATAFHWAIDPGSTMPIIGASGAIAAVLGAFAVTYPHARIRTLIIMIFVTVIELPAYLFLLFWFGVQLFSGLGAMGGQMDGGVAWWAHVGGFIAGAAAMPLLSMIVPPDDAAPHSTTIRVGEEDAGLARYDPWRRDDHGFRL
jgi:membrane associated rhomboid family serine protease